MSTYRVGDYVRALIDQVTGKVVGWRTPADTDQMIDSLAEPGKRAVVVDAITAVNATALGLVDGDMIQARGRDTAGDVDFGFPFLVESSGTANNRTTYDIGGGLFARLMCDEFVSMDWCGGVGDGVADDQTPYNRALADGRPIFLPLGKRYLVTDDRNRDGRVIYGPGRIIKAVTGGVTQKNSYAPFVPVRNRQYLWKVKSTINSGTHLNIAIVGDSTATNGYGLNIEDTVRDECRNIGVNVATVVNSAVAGTGWTSGASVVTSILDGYGAQKDLLIIKYGINEAAVDANGNPDVLALRNAMGTQLTNIRASTYGGYADLSILLIMPNVLGASALNTGPRNKSWIEAIAGTYADVADAFQCAVYNPYVEASSAVGGENTFMDANLVHPQVNFNLDIWCRAIRETLHPFVSLRRNRFVNLGASGGFAPSQATGLLSYPWGLSVLRTDVGDGWFIAGTVHTTRQVDNTGIQWLFGYQLGYPQVFVRTWLTGTGWTTWSGQNSAVDLTLLNSWVVGAGSPAPTPQARRTENGLVVLSGSMRNGTATNGTQLFTLPAGYRPAGPGPAIFIAVKYVAAVPDTTLIRITTAGVCTIERNADTGYLGLDGICFFAAQ